VRLLGLGNLIGYAVTFLAVFNDSSWAFQTKSDFKIIRTLPKGKASGVPTNFGIEITFSHDNYKDLDEYFEITPEVEGFFERHKQTAVLRTS